MAYVKTDHAEAERSSDRGRNNQPWKAGEMVLEFKCRTQDCTNVIARDAVALRNGGLKQYLCSVCQYDTILRRR